MNLSSGEISIGEGGGLPLSLRLHEGEDFIHTPAYIYPSGKEVLLRKLTESGEAKLATQRTELFENPQARRFTIPLNKDDQFQNGPSVLRIGDVLSMDMLLAVSLIRRRNGGYVCKATDNFSGLKKQNIRAVVANVSKKQPELLFEIWPPGYLRREFVTDRLGPRPTEDLTIVREPVTIGPNIEVSLGSLLTGQPREDFLKWLGNAIVRNIPDKK